MIACLFAFHVFRYPVENRSAFRQFLTKCSEIFTHGPQDPKLRFWAISASYVEDKWVKFADSRTKSGIAITVKMHPTINFRKLTTDMSDIIFNETGR